MRNKQILADTIIEKKRNYNQAVQMKPVLKLTI
jgi:hypothetical protein